MRVIRRNQFLRGIGALLTNAVATDPRKLRLHVVFASTRIANLQLLPDLRFSEALFDVTKFCLCKFCSFPQHPRRCLLGVLL